MNDSRSDFARIYTAHRHALTGTKPGEPEIDENYHYYLELVELAGRPGDLHFMLNDQKEMTWEFSPRVRGAPKS
ncbi:hypothetical protein [Bradyrhizobium sp. SZCCHNRI1009]|uniref:hypothetical protein n=1 Tax=Bradyrhizobium sp. SZCCHNRI1009 TaxID=3057277 RepID=UPI002916A83A|nr:hypothetical protein [Bradyrhizobium sp. SZCCHNRI1009]